MPSTYTNFIYDEERGFVFAYVPKIACTNWKSLLRYMAGHEDWLDSRRAHDKANGGLRYLDLQGSDAALLDNPEIRKYAMVRDPYSRTLSAYLNKVESRLPVQPEIESEDHFTKAVRELDRFRQEDLGADAFPKITFEVFLRWLQTGKSPFTKDEHWALQTTLLRQPGLQFDILGRFENITEDAPRILRAMGCDRAFPSQHLVNFTPTDAQSKVAQYYTPATYALVDSIFVEDFEKFGYEHKKGPMTADTTTTPCTTQAEMPFTALIGSQPSVIEEISENDWMWKSNKNTGTYLDTGWSVGRTLFAANLMTGQKPERILDFGCGHGRVMRWMRALYPDAEIIAADRGRDAVDFCTKTFGAVPVYSNDTYEDIPLGGYYDMIWVGSVYTHLPINLWSKLTRLFYHNLRQGGLLIFSYAGPYVANRIIEGERNVFAEVPEKEMRAFLDAYRNSGFGYSRHEGVGDREWGRSIISHERLFQFLKEENLSIVLLGEKLYGDRQDIVTTRKL